LKPGCWYRPVRKSFIQIVIFSGRPERITLAVASAARIDEDVAARNAAYAAGLGLGHCAAPLASFHTCHAVTGRCGSDGCAAQNVPPVP
jgi:hypothetical protein